MSCAAFPFVPRAYIEGKIHAMAPEAKAMLATIQDPVGAPILAPIACGIALAIEP